MALKMKWQKKSICVKLKHELYSSLLLKLALPSRSVKLATSG
jgi:hypothetical protein